jgi:cobalt-precorrin 5A hydrolase
MKIAIVSINNPSLESANRLKKYIEDEVIIYNKECNSDGYIMYDKLDDILPTIWQEYDAIIFLVATGIVVRKIAPYMQSKASDPAIIVMSLDLKQIIPLISGHIGGANELSNTLAKRIDGAISFTTTATDQTKTFAFDMFAKQMDFEIQNLDKLASISNSLINKSKVSLISYPSIFHIISKHSEYNPELIEFVKYNEYYSCNNKNRVFITPQNLSKDSLLIRPKHIYLGLGMNRGVKLYEIKSAIEQFLLEHNLEHSQIKNIASFSAKADEKALLEYAKEYNFDIKFFDEEDINSLELEFSDSRASEFFGIKGVAEPSAVLVSKYKELFLKKRVYNQITIAGAF